MTHLRSIAVAMFLAAGMAGTAEAAPANLGPAAPPVTAERDGAVTPVYHWRRRCWPVRRWVWTHWGWRYRYVGTRCAPRYRHYRYYPRYHYRYRHRYWR